VGLAVFFPKNTSFTQSYAKEENIEEITEYELNRHRLNIQNIISENSDIDKVKEQVTEERDIEFSTEYNNNPALPKSEEVITQEGVLGKENVTAVKTYENGDFVEEIILSKETLVEPISKMIDIGTSEFLAKHNVHIGDTMYFIDTANLKESADDSSETVAEIKKSLDVKLLELPSEEWCKVSFDNIEGYVKTSNLTSAYSTPNIVEKNRIQRILIKVNIGMELNKTSGLTLNDYKKIFTDISSDTNKIFQDNYTAFYNAEKKYNINGIFLASIAIHESSWGTSQIAIEKKNLFGYGSYDSTPYESSFEFSDYSESIETVAKSLVKYYLNPSGTKIYDGEFASAWYYNGPTLQGVNTRYASDEEWHTKVFNYMETLYNRLQ
jgi:flagellum-specific peptidoglycan hydrolase FlgJ